MDPFIEAIVNRPYTPQVGFARPVDSEGSWAMDQLSNVLENRVDNEMNPKKYLCLGSNVTGYNSLVSAMSVAHCYRVPLLECILVNDEREMDRKLLGLDLTGLVVLTVDPTGEYDLSKCPTYEQLCGPDVPHLERQPVGAVSATPSAATRMGGPGR